MHQAKDLTWKQERFVSEYLLSGNAAEAVRRAGYQTRYPSEAMVLKDIRRLEQH